MQYENLTLPQLMLLWGSLTADKGRVEALIKSQVLDLKQTQTVHNIRATYGQGRGSYNYEKIALGMDVEQEKIETHTSRNPTTNWKAICAELEQGADVGGKQKFYTLQREYFTPGKEQVRLSIDKPKASSASRGKPAGSFAENDERAEEHTRNVAEEQT